MKLFAVIAMIAAFALPANGATTRTARVTVTDYTPFTVHGARFLAHERVTVVVEVQSRYVHRLRATATGTFTTRFWSVSLDRCTGFAIEATGNRGSKAFLKAMPQCPPPD